MLNCPVMPAFGSLASSPATDLSSVAFTGGPDVSFEPGAYDPGGGGGQALLGHELSHVVQQAQGGGVAAGDALGHWSE